MYEITSKSGRSLSTQRADSAVELADLIGWDKVAELFAYYAGRDYIYVPEQYSDDHQLVDAVGEECAAKIIEYMPRDRIAVISLSRDYVDRTRRRERLLAAVLGGKHSSSEIAREFGISTRWVRGLAQQLGVRLPFKQPKNRTVLLSRLRAEGTAPETIAAIALETNQPESWIAKLARRVEAEATPEAAARRTAEKQTKAQAAKTRRDASGILTGWDDA